MKHFVTRLALQVVITCCFSMTYAQDNLTWQQKDSIFIRQNYQKEEYHIPMRDGTKLFTIVYAPKDQSKSYPILMKRTCYGVKPYGKNNYANKLGPSRYLMRDKYIFVYQDVRGRYMSEGKFDNMRPHIPKSERKSKDAIDESTDTYDTVDWLIKNIKNNNGRAGQWGISYPGFYTIAGAVAAHPALKASSPQAPIADFFFDDFHHHGAYLQSYWLATAVFGYQKDSLTTTPWYSDKIVKPQEKDGYDFYLNMGSLKNADQYYGKDNFFWQQLKEHPNYDAFWQKRSILPHLQNINHAVMTVGGWFDAEDLFGPLNIYKTIEKNHKKNQNTIVMGPWSHGDWSREKGFQAVGNIYFGDSISTFYQKEIEFDFFDAHLKGKGKTDLPEAYMFDTGKKEWRKFDVWPPQDIPAVKLYFNGDNSLSFNESKAVKNEFSEYVSDPNKPVPYTEDQKIVFTPRKYMTDDQRFAARRPDVLVFETEKLSEEVLLAGEIAVTLNVSTTGTAGDWIVKLIDVYPHDHPKNAHTPAHIQLGGYQQMVRSEVMRGRFRESYSKPIPFVSNEVTTIRLPLQDILHTFKKGHKVMIQVQSSWFPLIDRNPQKYVENIFEAEESDFIKTSQRVYHSEKSPSFIEIGTNVHPNYIPLDLYKK